MLINLKKLLRLPVYTVSGHQLGQVLDVEIDLEQHFVHRYRVGSRYFGQVIYLIAPAQIKSITAEKMVVEDGLLPMKKVSTQAALSPASVLEYVHSPRINHPSNRLL